MPQTLDKTVLEDAVAVSMARAVAAANERARREGIELRQSLVAATEHSTDGETFWRISYGPRDFVRQRGGDLIVEVGIEDGLVRRVLRGQ